MASVTGRSHRVTLLAAGAVLRPDTVDDVRDAVRDALAMRTPVRICGADTWTAAGPPRDAARSLSLAGLSGVLAYVPGDLTITTLAGTTLAELSHVTAAQGQWLGLDPAGSRLGTVGATIATASAGPLAHALGTPRDLVLGLDAVTGYGDIVRPGGRVVKNVAGFDLVRLFTGSWGTLGPITSLTLRLRALPVHDLTLAMPLSTPGEIAALVDRLREPTVSLLACEWLGARTAAALGVGDGRDVLLLRLGGNDAFVRGQRVRLEQLAPCAPCDPAVWGALAAADSHAAAVVRVSGAVSTWPARVARLRDALPVTADVLMHGTVGRGMVRIIVRGNAEDARAALQLRVHGEQRHLERAPDAWWAAEPDAFADGLAGRIRQAFDPALICNRRRVSHA
jgi:glycolate oxidase FAD binding subunit